jgi:glycosyltransferase involved in cell wall biosynthesis
MKILLVTSRYPWPPRRGDQMRAVQVLDFLTDEHEVTLLAPAPGRDQPPPPANARYRVELYRPGGTAIFPGLARAVVKQLPLQTGLFYQPDLGRKLRALAPRHDLGILQLVRLAIHVEDLGDTPFMVDLIDSLSLNFSLRAAVDRWWLAPLLKVEARLLAIAERRLAERSVRMLVVCERDRQALANRLPPDLAAKVSVVRLSVRERTVDPPLDQEKLWREGDKGPVLVMTGNLGYFVNADAATWWLRGVWPQLRNVRPDIRLVIAGDRPSPALRQEIEKAGARLIESPRDLRSIIAQATLSIAPMRCGSGVPIKVLEAWAVATRCVRVPARYRATDCAQSTRTLRPQLV